jgi:uncharacterized protein YcbX
VGLVPRVARLNVTPVKSTALHHPHEIRVHRGGAVGDRSFFFVNGEGRRFSGATKAPILPIRATYEAASERLELRLPNGIVVSGSALAEGRAIDVDFYGRSVSAHVVEGDFTEALSTYAGREILLVRSDREGQALDVRPVTIVSLESVAELAHRGGHDGPLSPARFRMTIEIEGVSSPHEEDTWSSRRVRIGEVELLVGDPVPRCVVTTLDPETGVKDFPTLNVIKSYRSVSRKGNVHFGVYAEVVTPGSIRVGDPVEPS